MVTTRLRLSRIDHLYNPGKTRAGFLSDFVVIFGILERAEGSGLCPRVATVREGVRRI